uniref:VOC domain-containing protein n=1 Tax=Picea sitchensis TaxID=3332 RepID=B8LNA7_PICSI|nr:unknown [Picea sitchensis]
MVNSIENAGSRVGALSLKSLNHVSFVCRSIEDSIKFYENVLGFVRVKRPGSFDFNGAWLFNYGIGIHLLQSKDPDSLPKKTEINPRDNHISFQCEDVQVVERKLQEMNVKYVKRIVEDGGIYVDQLFIHDPDGFMVEVCNCENFPVEPIVGSAPACVRRPSHIPSPPIGTTEKKEIQSIVAKQMAQLVVDGSPGQDEFAIKRIG